MPVKERLKLKQQKDVTFYGNQIKYSEEFIANPQNETLVTEMDINIRLESLKAYYKRVISNDYLESLVGTIGADPLYRKS